MNTEYEFKLEFERLKKETHKMFSELFNRYTNVKNWDIKFNYNWSVNCTSFVDKESNGWYDKMKQDSLDMEDGIK